jgi:hypothetical protein
MSGVRTVIAREIAGWLTLKTAAHISSVILLRM